MSRSAKLNEGCISPIYKKKDPDDVANYRPITLLNTDYKAYTKALSMRLAEAAPDIINTDQAGFLRNRSIFDQVKTTKLVTDYMNRANKEGAIVALDQEKAYDKILLPYLWEVLRKFGFPEKFINTLQSLYDNAETTVMINGELSRPFIVLRGVRQGDALSCLLFNIAIEPLAAAIRGSPKITGIRIPGTRNHLKIKLFADDTTVFLSEIDSIEDLRTILHDWCGVSGAKFNIEKTEIIPLGNRDQRERITTSRRLNEMNPPLPNDVHIAKDGEPVRVLGAWLGNDIDQATTWAPIMENVYKRLKRWGAARHSLEGRRLIIQMQVAGVTQYLTKVQGMPKGVEAELNRQIRKFMWNYEKSDTVNQSQMFAPHRKGGKKLLDIEARNKAIHLTWLRAYMNMGNGRATWTYFADAIISTDIPPSHKIIDEPGSKIMPILQTWRTRSIGSTLPEDLKQMLKVAREFGVQVTSRKPSQEACESLPLWYHIKSNPSARALYRSKTARCLRKRHNVSLVSDALQMIDEIDEEHEQHIRCRCNTCKTLRAEAKCPHPSDCLALNATLINKITPKWNPENPQDEGGEDHNTSNIELEEDEVVVNKMARPEDLRDTVTIFNDAPEPSPVENREPNAQGDIPTDTVAYTDSACINNGQENAAAGSGVWYGDNDPRNKSLRVPHKNQSNQTGELTAILAAVRDNPTSANLRIISDSKYAIDGLTKHAARWEDKNWIGNQNGDLFRDITAWVRWRKGTTTLRWVKGHNGTRGNEEADKLAGEGAKMPIPVDDDEERPPPGLTAQGAKISKMEQRDFYQIIRDKRRIPTRSRTNRTIGRIQACAEVTLSLHPKEEAVWEATRHKDFTKKTRDFLWKSTQHAYKIGEYWENISGYEGRGICPICQVQEDMDHILTECSAKARSTAWNLANDLWAKKYNSRLPTNLGDILGCGLANLTNGDNQNDGKNRLYRILMSETAYLTWKIRNERRIRDSDADERTTTPAETATRWRNAINKRLTTDRYLTDENRFGKRALDENLVKRTWSGCLDNEEGLPDDWFRKRGVLVGISWTAPLGAVT